jgi:hypothetical protein
MELNDKVTQLEDEIKILKNEVQSVLLDLRESFLKNENPFNAGGFTQAAQPIIINQQAPAAVEEPPAKKNRKPDTDNADDEDVSGKDADSESNGEKQEKEAESSRDEKAAVPEPPAGAIPEKPAATEKTISEEEPANEPAQDFFPEPVKGKNTALRN